jgi:stage II sporulation protein AA (anti-sigma F factor antagonist)
LRISVRLQGRTATAALAGEFDLTAAKEVRQELDRLIDGGHRRLIIDLRKVPFLDSSGLGVLLGRYGRLRELGGEMFLVGAQPPVRTVLQMSGVPKVVPVLRSESEVPL